MKYSLILIGAHDGSKTEWLVRRATALGQVLLVEPVPWLFERIQRRYQTTKSVDICRLAIAETPGLVDFYAPSPTAVEVAPWGDQLGSLNRTHAEEHDPRFKGRIEAIKVDADSVSNLLEKYEVTEIDTLMTDTEGHDARILLTFPFEKCKPLKILFEHRHSDGVFHIGQNFAKLVGVLDREGYKTRFLDAENCLAELKGASGTSRSLDTWPPSGERRFRDFLPLQVRALARRIRGRN